MMGLWTWLTGGSGAATKAVDGIYNGVDALFYTDEEKASDYVARNKLYIEYQKATMPQNVARRIIALMIVGNWLILINVSVILLLIGSDVVDNVTEIVMYMSASVTVIVSFYFYKRIKSND